MDNEIQVIYSLFFYYYKAGFNNGKEDAFNIIYGKLDTTDQAYYLEDSWDSLGYRDGYEFYKNLYNKYGTIIPVDMIVGEQACDILLESYFKRIAEYNQNANEQISAIVLALLPHRPKEPQRWIVANG